MQNLTSRQFATRFRMQARQIGWFLGAGASAAAGIPTAYAMITDFKKALFCQLSGTNQRAVDANDPIWAARIDQFLASRAILPAPGDPSEYAAAFEAVYPDRRLRRAYIDDASRKGTPCFAHRVLASVISIGRVPCIFTTNFDPLVEQATTITDQMLPAGERVHLTVAAIDNPDRAALALREQRSFLAKLHGDYPSVALMNTPDELRAQDATMRSVLTSACERFGMIFVGYSGRDGSVMEALTEACSEGAFPGGIYWVTGRSASPLPAVTSFLDTASRSGIECHVVECQTFDELAADIADTIALPDVLERHVYEGRPAPIITNVPVPVHEERRFPVLQCSAIPILGIPRVARRITLGNATTTPQLRQLLRDANVWAVVAGNGREVAAFGPDAGLLTAFAPLAPRLAGTVGLNPNNDSWALGLIYDALARAVCRDRPLFARLRRSGHLVLAAKGPDNESKEASNARAARLAPLRRAYSAALFGTVPEHGFPFNEGVQLRMEHVMDRWWCAFEPITYVELPRRPHGEAPENTEDVEPALARRADPVIDWRRERWATRYNPAWAQIIPAWATMLAGDDGTVRAFGLSAEQGQDAEFQLSPVTAWSRPRQRPPVFPTLMPIDYAASKLAPFTLLDEPNLTFEPGDERLDVSPLRGLDTHGPYSSGSFPQYTPQLRLATLGPAAGRENMAQLVNTLRSPQTPGDRREYVPPFGRFQDVFGVPLVAAARDAHIRWPDDLQALGPDGSPPARLMHAVRDGLNRLALIRDQFDVLLVHLPDAWEVAYRGVGFDVHDSIKAIGAAQNIPTQVINDGAFTFRYKASLAWRLGIALYVKAGGIPWKLAPLPGVPAGTAYIGLAYALRGAARDAHYVTCCSQVFDADGGGMQFVAFEARDPVAADREEARRNPFLTRSDMRAVMSRSLALYQARNGGVLPRRLVVHKTTSFKADELQGCFDAATAVPEVECIEVASTPGWRGVWLKESRNSNARSEADGYPVPRGTMLIRSGTSALLWVAGNAPRASLRRDYFQGSKSIPRPINLVRHAGIGAMEFTGLEALALTKMDWNNDALYDPVPVTIRYSQRLARTIANVPELPGHTYPYRLFM